jgi:hypothetical protein
MRRSAGARARHKFSRGPFGSFDEATERLSEVLAIVVAIPESVLPSHVDHSQDDLIDRISRITSVEDALAFLQGLTRASGSGWPSRAPRWRPSPTAGHRKRPWPGSSPSTRGSGCS